MHIATIGIDPGTKETAVISLDASGDILAGSRIIWEDFCTVPSHAAEILAVVDEYTSAHGTEAVHLEDVVPPVGQMGLIDPRPLLTLHRLVGFLQASRPDWRLVRPGGHGSQPLASYPAALVGKTERKGTGKLRHLRSAYDVAHARPWH